MPPSVGTKCNIRTCITRTKRDGSQDVHEIEGFDEPDPETDEMNDYALICKRTMDDKGIMQNATLLINSPYLLSTFREVIGFYPTVPSDFESPFEMSSPFQMLYHYWDELAEAKENLGISNEEDEKRMHLNLLLDFLQRELGPGRARVKSMLSKGHISFAYLWTIFRPGDLVYTEINGHPWLLELEKTAYEESMSRGKFLEVYCKYTDYDGKNVGQANRKFQVIQKQSFAAENPCEITKLPIFPRKFLKGRDDLEDILEDRGKRFLSYQGVLVRKYDGLAQYLREPPWDFYNPEMDVWPGVWMPFTEIGRVIVDRKTFQEDQHMESVAVASRNSQDRAARILCAPFVFGYSLARKDWCRFYVDNLSEIDWNKDAFRSLILKDEQKSVLEALVTSHRFPENARDQVEQKGKGLVILLHGSPGSGKTLTAESAAESTQKALVSAAMGDLNKENSPYFFEYALKRILQYATIWKAIVLLDEADVFLEARTDRGVDAANRNALVAVFLKHLEYFSGIVFLTSNRVGVFDQAMKSRIHLALEYCPPEIEIRRRMWLQCLSAIPEDEIEFDPEEDVDYLIKDKVNGREIANAVNTARTLARWKKEKVGREHIEIVLGIRRDFDASIGKMSRELQHRESRVGTGGMVRQNSLAMSGIEEER